MARYIVQGIARDIAGNILASALVKAYVANTTTLATFYESDSGSASSGVYTDTYGAWKIYFDTTDYTYTDSFDISITKSGYNTQTIEDINPISVASVIPLLAGYVSDAQAAQAAAEAAQAAAEGARDTALQAETNAELAETNAEAAQTAAELAQTAAELAETNAETAETNAETAETNAESAATLASDWASKAEDSVVADGKYSAYHWAQKAEDSAASASAGVFNETTAPSTTANQLKVYAKDVTGTAELFIRKESDGAEIQVTSGAGLSGAGAHAATHHSGGADSIKLDDFAAPDDNTDLNASTSAHGLLVKATAPAAGLRNVVAIDNGETAYTNKALFDATDPSTQAFGDSASVGTAMTAARRDHKHAMPDSSLPDSASESGEGIIEIATQAEVDDGTDDSRAITPLKLYGTPGIYRRNAIINGAMVFAQRGTSTATAASGTFVADRFAVAHSSDAVVTVSRDTDVPSGESFKYSAKIDVTTADSTIAAAQYFRIVYKVEGYDFVPFVGKTGVLSFWVKSPKTGVHCVAFRNTGYDRSYIAEYSVSSADTWEHKTIAVTFDYSGGTWNYTDGIGVAISWSLATGSDGQSTKDSWLSADDVATSSQVNCLDSTSNNFYLTGVQFEVGDVATEFEHLSYGFELLLCQRYYQLLTSSTQYYPFCVGGSYGATLGVFGRELNPTMRAAPTISSGGTFAADYFGTRYAASAPALSAAVPTYAWISSTLTGTAFAGAYVIWLVDSAVGGGSWIAFSAEL